MWADFKNSSEDADAPNYVILLQVNNEERAYFHFWVEEFIQGRDIPICRSCCRAGEAVGNVNWEKMVIYLYTNEYIID